ncbi:hypothetical protein CLHUN_23710 [Ruminiclostridium hungatei]|uniref:DUF5362 domain-containing protein n=1 Tax=Ruminiclostridium hungatei TaxID=48256 RepID=A0A1V4SIC2_RUMHU|nr:DUF5362 domain-containing protein [Ruminiclostridium hungatei]OPX43652.1 hypothetical protein CLHUN_23710 [Ruminiclostridium hungatei]
MDQQSDTINPAPGTPAENFHHSDSGYGTNGNTNVNYNYNPNYNQNYNQNFFMPSVLDSLAGWMKFLGIYTIVTGAITCIGIITAALGIPMIFAGIGLTNASKNLKEYRQFNNQFTLNNFFTYLNKYFKIYGIFAIIGIVISLIYIAFILIFAIMAVYTYNGY